MPKNTTPTCRHPDRHCPKMLCGYPLPCPHHTVVVDMGAKPPTATFPLTSHAIRHKDKIAKVMDALEEED